MQLKLYPKYKDSGIQWIGKIPEGWEVKKLKYLVKDLPGNGFPEEEQGKDVGDIPFYKVSDINGSEKFVEVANNFVSKKTIKDHKWNTIPKYSLIAPKIGEALKKNHRKITKVKCIIDNNCIAFNTFDIDYNYNYYLFKLINFEWFVNPGAVPSLSIEKLRSSIVSLPLLTEQTTIANFLDKRTAKIDTLIEKDKKLIALFKEKRIALINHAVTKGLDPNVKLRDSGVPWIGKITEGWEARKLKYIGKSIIGLTYSPEEILDNEGTLVLRASNIKNNKIDLTDKVYVNKNIPKKMLTKAGDILICSRSGSKTLIGKNACIYKNNTGHSFGVFMTVFRSRYWKFISYVFNSIIFYSQLNSCLTTTINQLTIESLNNILVLFPDINTQNQIIDFLNKETEMIDKTIEKIENKIKLLEEYKKSLIHHVITGKIDVREAVA